MEDNSVAGGLIVFAVAAAIYLFPAIVGSARAHRQAGAIWVLNIFLGWTVIGWVAALVWACTNSPPAPVMVARPSAAPAAPISPAGEVERLAELRARGVLTEEEFVSAKRRALGEA